MRVRKSVFCFIAALIFSIFVAGCGGWLDMLNDSEDLAERDTDTQTDIQTGEAAGEVYPFPYEFAARDLYGEKVTQEALGEKEIFFVHLWATWCGPCVVEMGDLARIAAAYGENVGFLGLLLDYNENREGAVKLTEANGVDFLNVHFASDGLLDLALMADSGFVPTTIIIDGEGGMIGGQIIGAHALGYGAYIEEALKTVRNRQ